MDFAGKENRVVPGRVPGGSGTGAGQEGCGAIERRGNGVVLGRVLGGMEGRPRVGEEGRVWGGPGAGVKRIPRVGRRSREGGIGVCGTGLWPGEERMEGRAVPGFGAVPESKGSRLG